MPNNPLLNNFLECIKMNWQDKGYLININKYNENSSVAEFFTNNHGKTTGIIFGSSSKKNKKLFI